MTNTYLKQLQQVFNRIIRQFKCWKTISRFTKRQFNFDNQPTIGVEFAPRSLTENGKLFKHKFGTLVGKRDINQQIVHIIKEQLELCQFMINKIKDI
ncbi:unnamed protein product [Paramecium sonneborni]|uniref:Uncharacterized protein n=1 Tax=Paramecium sonneborni TaxID=65129 RepID=A0A8S1RSD5_9CILI|nr:unnamed protein product [Paramecium sonneborni]